VTTTYTRDEFSQLLTSQDYDLLQRSIVNRWLERGDGAAVYENHDLGHPMLGHKVITSFGSAAAQLEVSEPPERLPDGLLRETTGRINWRYSLVGTYRGEKIPLEVAQ